MLYFCKKSVEYLLMKLYMNIDYVVYIYADLDQVGIVKYFTKLLKYVYISLSRLKSKQS